MLFNSFDFLVFFPLVCAAYFALGCNRLRNPFLLAASYFFYMSWKPVYALLLLGVTLVSYTSARMIENSRCNRKAILAVTVAVILSVLYFFKYASFVNKAVSYALSLAGFSWTVHGMDILLPVGVSFYTLQSIGYCADVYKCKIRAERNFITYALFLSFFPQLVAGPVERASNLLPQFHSEHEFNYGSAVAGFKQMLWGFFMKLCVADVLAGYVNAVYDNYTSHSGITLILAAVFFSFQIYGDFAGYSNIAIGAARVMGFRLMDNFNRPYLSPTVGEFWRRWHISLSSWLKDYVYIPMGGSRVSYRRYVLNILVTFVLSGVWHGAGFGFLIWGLLHGLWLVTERLAYGNRSPQWNGSGLGKAVSIFFSFCVVTLFWVFFRVHNPVDAVGIIGRMFTQSGPLFVSEDRIQRILCYGTVSLAILSGKEIKDSLGLKFSLLGSSHKWVRYAAVAGLVCYILLFGSLDGAQFVYFQF